MLADLCRPARLANARRFGVNTAALLRLLQAETAAKAIKAFAGAAPERRADAE
jgi:maleylpyruvate isomerase